MFINAIKKNLNLNKRKGKISTDLSGPRKILSPCLANGDELGCGVLTEGGCDPRAQTDSSREVNLRLRGVVED
jgi:hypothetical protein